MSEPVTPLNRARFEGFATIEEIGPRGMIALRADLADRAVAAAVQAVTGGDLPERLGFRAVGDNTTAWMSPDELLLMVPRSYVPETLATLGERLADRHHLAADVSDARALFRLSGPALRDVLAKLTPADVSPAGLAPGMVRRTRLAQVAAAILLRDETTAEILCFRSLAAYAFDLLSAAAAPGSEVGLHAPTPLEQ